MFHSRKIYHLQLPGRTRPKGNLIFFVEHRPRTRIKIRLKCKDKERPRDTIQVAGATVGALILAGEAIMTVMI
jgi:hypothetical protein